MPKEKLYTDDQLKSAFLAGVACGFVHANPSDELFDDEEINAAKQRAEDTIGVDWRGHIRMFAGFEFDEEFAIAEADERRATKHGSK